LSLELGTAVVKMRVGPTESPVDGDTVPIAFDPNAIHLFDAETGLRLESS